MASTTASIPTIKIQMDCGAIVRHMPVVTSVWPDGQRPRYINRLRLHADNMTAAQEAHDLVCACSGRTLKIQMVPKGTIAALAGTSHATATAIVAYTGSGLAPEQRPLPHPRPHVSIGIHDAQIIQRAQRDWIELHRAMLLQDHAHRLPGGTWQVTDKIVQLPNICSSDAQTCSDANTGSGCRHLWAVRLDVATRQAGKQGADEQKALHYRRARQIVLRTREHADWLLLPERIDRLKECINALWPRSRPEGATPAAEAEREVSGVLYLPEIHYDELPPPGGDEDLETRETQEDTPEDQEPATLTTVININTAAPAAAQAAVFVGRGSRWGNPYLIGRDGTRTEVLRKYAQYILDDPSFITDVKALQGQTLACYCAPRQCHADLLAELADAPASHHGTIVRAWAELPDPPQRTKTKRVAGGPPLPGLEAYI